MGQTRLHRSELAVPASNAHMVDKARGIDADIIMLDLEDSVSAGEKDGAREIAIEALAAGGWRARSVSIRINGLDTSWCYRDIVEITERVGPAVGSFTVPKVGSAGDVHFVATLLDQVEQASRPGRRIGLSTLIETAAGMANVHEIASACPERMEAMVFGVADYAASLESSTTNIGGFEAGYAVLAGTALDSERRFHCGDQWHYALSQVAVACRANGLRPIDGPFGDLTDPDGYLAAARRAAVLGYEGKWAIHPSQVPLANDVFTPDAELIERSRRIVAAMEAAADDGLGAIVLDGALVDAASARMAQNLIKKVEQIDELPEDADATAVSVRYRHSASGGRRRDAR